MASPNAWVSGSFAGRWVDASPRQCTTTVHVSTSQAEMSPALGSLLALASASASAPSDSVSASAGTTHSALEWSFLRIHIFDKLKAKHHWQCM